MCSSDLFNSRTGVLEGNPPPDWKGEVSVKVTVRDNHGHQASQIFKISTGAEKSAALELLPRRATTWHDRNQDGTPERLPFDLQLKLATRSSQLARNSAILSLNT